MPSIKYISKINKGGDDLYIKDSEARQLIEENSLKILGETSSLDPTDTYAKNSLITCAGDVYISSSSVQGLPNNIVTCSDETVTCNTETVTCGENSIVSWVKIVSGQVTANRIAPGAITEGAIADGSITTSKIANNSISTQKIQSQAITSPKLASDSVTASKIANNAVSTAKIVDLAVTTNKISDTAIVESKVESGAITSTKIASNAVGSTQLAAFPVYIIPNTYQPYVTDDGGTVMSAEDLTTMFGSAEHLASLEHKSFIIQFAYTPACKIMATCTKQPRQGMDLYNVFGIYIKNNQVLSVHIEIVTGTHIERGYEIVSGSLHINEAVVVNESIV